MKHEFDSRLTFSLLIAHQGYKKQIKVDIDIAVSMIFMKNIIVKVTFSSQQWISPSPAPRAQHQMRVFWLRDASSLSKWWCSHKLMRNYPGDVSSYLHNSQWEWSFISHLPRYYWAPHEQEGEWEKVFITWMYEVPSLSVVSVLEFMEVNFQDIFKMNGLELAS